MAKIYGERYSGTDYFQNMTLWAVPAAMKGKDLASLCAPGKLIDRVIKAGCRNEKEF